MILRARTHHWQFPRPALIMGIVNVTPDSFSDGGQFVEAENATKHALRLIDDGADIIDIGGESTRPYAALVSETEELARVIPVIEHLAKATKCAISIDTQKPAVARAALKAGASLINDIAANRTDSEMWHVATEFGAGYICMHMQGAPQTMQANPVYNDVVWEVLNFFGERFERLIATGVHPEQIVFDPGFGFGKNLEHNLKLLGSLRQFRILNRPVMAGVSRKSFMGKLLGVEVDDRRAGSVAGAAWAVEHGANIVRVHDVAATHQAVRLIEAVLQYRT